MKKTIARVDGSLAIAVYHNGKLMLYKDSNPLYLLTNDQDKKEEQIFYFTSKPDYLADVFYKCKRYYGIFERNEKKYNFLTREMENEELLTFNFSTGKFDLDTVKSGEIDYKDVEVTKSYTSNVTCSNSNVQRTYPKNFEVIHSKKDSKLNEYHREKDYNEGMEEKKFNAFLIQVNTTSRRISDDQRLKLFDSVNKIVEPVWDKYAGQMGEEYDI